MGEAPIRDVAHLAHVEIKSPKPEESIRFFTQLLGLSVTAQQGQSVYLRAYGDYPHHTLKITEAKEAGLGHVSWRAYSPESLEGRARALKEAGFGRWTEGDLGHGPSYAFTTPDGHPMELFYEVERYKAPAGEQPILKNAPNKIPLAGAAVRRLDHVNLLAGDVVTHREFMQQHLGFKLRERVVHHGDEKGAWLSVTTLVHDIAFMKERGAARGRLHHLCYWYDQVGDLLRAADILREYGIHIEGGPAKHSITQAMFMYVYEPGGNRVELFNGGYQIFEPDWEPVTWTEQEKHLRVWWGNELPDSFNIYGTPIS